MKKTTSHKTEDDLTTKMKMASAKKLRQFYSKKEDDLTQKMKKTSPKNEDNLDLSQKKDNLIQKMKTTSDVVVSRDGVDKWCVDAKQVPTEHTEASKARQGDVPGAGAAVCGHKDKLECVDNVWECLPDCAKGPTRCGDSVTDM